MLPFEPSEFENQRFFDDFWGAQKETMGRNALKQNPVCPPLPPPLTDLRTRISSLMAF